MGYHRRNTMKYCPSCTKYKDVTEFGKCSSRSDGLLTYCKACANEKARKYRATDAGREKRKEYHTNWRAENPDYKTIYKSDEAKRLKINLSSVLSTRKVTEEQLVNFLNEQQGCCPICGQDFGLLDRAYNVDHNHETGKVRGLLCPDCNTKLGTYEKWVLKYQQQILAYLKRG